MAANFPNSPSNGQTFTSNGVTFTWDGSAWKQSASPGVKGIKGEVGDKGQKGEKGEKGEKGQKGEVGLTGNPGGDGIKGQKGEKGEDGAQGSDGSDGDKGQKGEASTVKGQKGEVGAQGDGGSDGIKGQKGEKGEVGEKGVKGEIGDKGQKGEIGVGVKGQKGELNDKGQKGEEGPQGGGAPVGQIIAWSGSSSSLPSGYFLCDGSAISRTTYAALYTIVGTTHGAGNGSSTFNLPDLRDRFVVGASNSTGDTTYPGVSPGATGGSADAILKSHTHNLQNHVHGVNLTTNDPGDHDHNVDTLNEFASTHGTWQTGGGYRQAHAGGTHRKPITSDAGGHTHTVSGNTGTPAPNTTDALGEDATNKNLPPFYALAYIIQYAQGGTTAKGQKGEAGDKGQKGEQNDKGQKGEIGVGVKGQKGEAGDKGQKGEIGTQGTGGNPGAKGQKGEVGDKGQKGEDNSTKGQKGELGADNSTKGQKGEEGTAASKGQKGEASTVKGQKGEDNSTKGQKGEVGTTTKGQKGEVGDKGQKGEVGADNSTKGQKGEAGDVNQKGVKGEPGGVMIENNRTSAYTLTASDDGKLVTTNSNVTVPQNVFSVPDAVTIVNNSSANITIIQGSGVTLRLTGTTVTGNRTIAPYGMASIICVASNVFFISGGGLT